MNYYAMPDMWSSQYDPMDDGYGIPLPLILLAIGGTGIGIAGATGLYKATAPMREATGPNDLARMAQNEKDKVDQPLQTIQGDTLNSGMLAGASSTREARYIGSFWLFRVARVALSKVGGSQEAQALVDEGDRLYRRGYSMSAETDPRKIAAIFTYVQSAVSPYSAAAANTLEDLGSKYSTALRKSYRDQTSATSLLVRPVVQTGKDVAETAERVADVVTAPFDFARWVGENKGLVIGGAVALVAINLLASAAITRRRSKQTAPKSAPRRRRRST